MSSWQSTWQTQVCPGQSLAQLVVLKTRGRDYSELRVLPLNKSAHTLVASPLKVSLCIITVVMPRLCATHTHPIIPWPAFSEFKRGFLNI